MNEYNVYYANEVKSRIAELIHHYEGNNEEFVRALIVAQDWVDKTYWSEEDKLVRIYRESKKDGQPCQYAISLDEFILHLIQHFATVFYFKKVEFADGKFNMDVEPMLDHMYKQVRRSEELPGLIADFKKKYPIYANLPLTDKTDALVMDVINGKNKDDADLLNFEICWLNGDRLICDRDRTVGYRIREPEFKNYYLNLKKLMREEAVLKFNYNSTRFSPFYPIVTYDPNQSVRCKHYAYDDYKPIYEAKLAELAAECSRDYGWSEDWTPDMIRYFANARRHDHQFIEHYCTKYLNKYNFVMPKRPSLDHDSDAMIFADCNGYSELGWFNRRTRWSAEYYLDKLEKEHGEEVASAFRECFGDWWSYRYHQFDSLFNFKKHTFRGVGCDHTSYLLAPNIPRECSKVVAASRAAEAAKDAEAAYAEVVKATENIKEAEAAYAIAVARTAEANKAAMAAGCYTY